MAETTLLDPAFMRKLELLRIQARRAFPGSMRGERRSTRRGASVEFADFRKYEAGDDFRHVDWNIYARLERLMLRQFIEEEDVRIDILVDQSQSMRFGEPLTKFDFARRAAAALTFLAVSSLDQVSVAVFDSAMRGQMRAARGRGHLLAVLKFLESLAKAERKAVVSREGVSDRAADSGAESDAPNEKAEREEKNARAANVADASARAAAGRSGGKAERTNLRAVLRAYQKTTTRPGILFVISDFLDESDFRPELRLLAQRKFDVNLLQVLADEELHPETLGDLLVVDSETGDEREITVNERAIAAYKKTLSLFTTELESYCRTSGIGYTLMPSSASFEDQLLKNLVASRLAG